MNTAIFFSETATVEEFFNEKFPFGGDVFTLDRFFDVEEGGTTNRVKIAAYRRLTGQEEDIDSPVEPSTEVVITQTLTLYFPSEFTTYFLQRQAAESRIVSEPEFFENVYMAFQAEYAIRSAITDAVGTTVKRSVVTVLYYSRSRNEWFILRNIVGLQTNKNDVGTGVSFTLSLTSFDVGIVIQNIKTASREVITNFSVNDLFYISLRDFILETDEENIIDIAKTIQSNYWHLIGLTDNISKGLASEGNSISYVITGRDLAKLFLEDGSHHYPSAYSGGSLFNTANELPNLFKRHPLSGEFEGYLVFRVTERLSELFVFIIEALSSTGIIPDEILSFYDERESPSPVYRGVWRLVYLVFDNNVRDRAIVDNTLQQEQGAVYNVLRKLIVSPFAEMIMDTYRDKFYLLVRQSPFTRDAILANTTAPQEGSTPMRVPNMSEQTEDTAPPTGFPYVFISDAVILSEQLSFMDDGDVYSWYRLEPKGFFFGNAEVLSFIPSIYFPEYVEVYGSKPFNVVHNYLEWDHGQTPGNTETIPPIRQDFLARIINDLKLVIEMHQYLPFVRKGTITLSIIDPGIKQGTFIIKENEFGQREVYYVNSVSYSYGIENANTNESTTITVSRGMVEEYIEGRMIDGVKYSYFDIINLEGPDTENLTGIPAIPWKVRPEVFNYFLRKQQFHETEELI